ncbi:hypothetical protein, partial [Escherichia coli]|uniref:hypothetical protein n=1 Tax=Escherichia coli TaxID=562 RepID=UPI001484D8AE
KKKKKKRSNKKKDTRKRKKKNRKPRGVKKECGENGNEKGEGNWIKGFRQRLNPSFTSIKLTFHWAYAWPSVFLAFLALLPLLLIAGLIHWRLGWLKAYQ